MKTAIDTTKQACRLFPGHQVIVEAKTREVLALCPLTTTPLDNGQFSRAVQIQAAIELADIMSRDVTDEDAAAENVLLLLSIYKGERI